MKYLKTILIGMLIFLGGLAMSTKSNAQDKSTNKGTPYWWKDGAEFTLDKQLENAWWIWNDKDMISDSDKGKAFVFTKNITLIDSVKNANLKISAQGKYTLYINNREVGSDDETVTLDKYDLKVFLKKGINSFRVKAKSDQWFAGLFIAGSVTMDNGEKLEILSDKSWSVSEEGKKGGKHAGEVSHGVNGGFWNNVGRKMVMPDEFYKLNLAIKAPGINWAKPYAGKKLKILAIVPRAKQRDLVELSRRMDIDLTTVFSDGFDFTKSQFTKPFWPVTKGMLVQDIRKELNNAFKKNFDIIIFGGISIGKKSEKLFFDTVANYIKDFVANGGGLVYTYGIIPSRGIANGKDKKGQIIYKRDYSFEKEITSNPVKEIPQPFKIGIPFKELPGFGLKKGQTNESGLKNAASLFSYGKGRIVRLNNKFSSGYGLLANPSNDNNDLHYQYYMSFVIKSLMWVAGEKPEIDIVNFPTKITVKRSTKSRMSFVLKNVPQKCVLDITVRSPKKSFVLPQKPFTSQGLERGAPILMPLFETKQKVSVGKTVPVNISLPYFPAGEYFVDIIVLLNGKKANWGTVALKVESVIEISSVKLINDVLNMADGKSAVINAEAVLSKEASVNSIVRFSILDNYNRIVDQKDEHATPGSKSIKTDFLVKKFKTTLGKIRAELMINKKSVSVELVNFTTIRRDWDKFTFFGWTAGPTGHQGNVYLRVLAELGLNASRMKNIDFTWLEAADQVAMPGYPAFPRWGAEKIDHKKLLNDYAQKAGKVAETQLKFDPIAFNNGDEFFYRSGSEEQPTRINAYRIFLQKKYRNIAGLNESWDSSYKSFNEIFPVSNSKKNKFVSLGEFRKHSSKTLNYSRLVDQWLDNYRAYNETAKVCLKAIKKVYPKARVGVDCPNWPHAFSGHDWYEFMQEFDYFAPYGRGGEIIPLKQARSYKRPGQFIGLEYGGYLYMAFNRKNEITDVDWQKWRLWNGLLQGFSSVLWYQLTPPGSECNLGPGFAPFPTLKMAAKEIRKIRNGYYTLFNKMNRDYGKIAIHDSILSRIVTAFAPSDFSGGSYGRNMDTHVAMNILENECGYQYTFVSNPQITNGELKKYRLLLMPLSIAISQKEANALRKFVENGGLLIADIRPGIFNGSGKWDDNAAISELFGLSFKKSLGRKLVTSIIKGEYNNVKIDLPLQTFPADPSVKLKSAKALCYADNIPLVTINEVGKGKAICLNIPFTYYKSTTTPDSLYAYKGDEGHNKLIRSLFNFLIEVNKTKRPIKVKRIDGNKNWLFGLETSYFVDGLAQYVGVTKFRKSDDEQATSIILEPKKRGHIYDMLTGEYIGEKASWKTNVSSVDIKLFSVLPYSVNDLQIQVDKKIIKQGEEIKGNVIIDNGGKKAVRHVINMQVIRPDGMLVKYLTQNLETQGSSGMATFLVPLALNELKGEWVLKFTDIATRIKKDIKLKVR